MGTAALGNCKVQTSPCRRQQACADSLFSRECFRVDPSIPAFEPVVEASSDSSSQALELITFQVVHHPSELGLVEPTLGNFSYDVRSLKYNMLWGSWRDFDLFLGQEQHLSDEGAH